MGQSACILEEWQAREVLQHLYRRLGSVRKLAEQLRVGKSSVHRWLQGTSSIPASVRMRLCEMLNEEELVQLLRGRELLKKYGLLDNEGRFNKAVAFALLDAMMQEETMKEDVLNYLLKYYKKELMERLSEALPRIELYWDESFERWLTEKKSKPISTRTLRDYRNLWLRCLEGKILGWHLLKQLEAKKMKCRDDEYHSTGWVRQIFRHYIRYLYASGRIDWDTYARLLLIVPGRRYGRKVSQKVVREEDVVRTIRALDENNKGDVLTVYLTILGSGARLEHVIEMINTWRPEEEIYVDYLNRNIKRLECFKEHCRYYMGKETDIKPVGFIFFPRLLIALIKTFRGRIPNRRNVYKKARRVGGIPAQYVRIYAVREMKRVIGDNDVYRFIVSKFSELSVSARHYMDLLAEADKAYPKYVERWLEIVNKSISLPDGDFYALKPMRR